MVQYIHIYIYTEYAKRERTKRAQDASRQSDFLPFCRYGAAKFLRAASVSRTSESRIIYICLVYYGLSSLMSIGGRRYNGIFFRVIRRAVITIEIEIASLGFIERGNPAFYIPPAYIGILYVTIENMRGCETVFFVRDIESVSKSGNIFFLILRLIRRRFYLSENFKTSIYIYDLY